MRTCAASPTRRAQRGAAELLQWRNGPPRQPTRLRSTECALSVPGLGDSPGRGPGVGGRSEESPRDTARVGAESRSPGTTSPFQETTMNPVCNRLRALAFLLTTVAGVATAQNVDTVTAGGWITGTPSGIRANFGLNARDPAAPSGQVNYVDHGIGMHVKSTS